MEKRFQLIAGALLAIIMAAPLQAALYQWTDENGRVHFSDRPSHESAQQKKMPKTKPSGARQSIPEDRQQRRQRMLEVYEKERAEKREAAAEAKQEKEERKRRCIKAKVDYENYNTAGAIYEYQEDGGRKYLSKEQRSDYISRLKAKVDKYCK